MLAAASGSSSTNSESSSRSDGPALWKRSCVRRRDFGRLVAGTSSSRSAFGDVVRTSAAAGPARTIDRNTNRPTSAKAIMPSVPHDCRSQLSTFSPTPGAGGSGAGMSWKVVTVTSSAALATPSADGSSWATCF